jgi:hypothetical protein
MSAVIFRPDVEAWHRHDQEQVLRRMDAVSAFEAQQAADRADRLKFRIAAGCLMVVVAVIMAVTR